MKTLPNFIMIGPGRTGTTWIYEVLREHPEVYTAKGIKETNFFNHEFDRGIEWYKDFFDCTGDEKAIGEISNLYFYDENVPQRIKKFIPDVKIITCLRDPTERLESAYYFKIRGGEINPDVSINAALDKFPDLVNDNLYYSKLKNYYQVFNAKQIKILFFDDLKSDPLGFAKQAFEFLNIDVNFIPSVIDQKVNPSAKIRFKSTTKIIDFIANNLRKYQLHFVLDFLKRNKLIQKALLQNVSKSNIPHLDLIEKKRLLEKYIPEIEQIEKITGRNLDSWKQLK